MFVRYKAAAGNKLNIVTKSMSVAAEIIANFTLRQGHIWMPARDAKLCLVSMARM